MLVENSTRTPPRRKRHEDKGNSRSLMRKKTGTRGLPCHRPGRRHLRVTMD
jgi:hypothetical protein